MASRCGSLRRAASADGCSSVDCIALEGPASPELLTAASGAVFTDEARPIGLASTVMFGDVEALAIRTAYTGEIGWELTVPRESAQAVYVDNRFPRSVTTIAFPSHPYPRPQEWRCLLCAPCTTVVPLRRDSDAGVPRWQRCA